MYSWIWRHLPFGLRGKIAGSLLLVAGIAALLWYAIFPAVEPHMPFNDAPMETGDQSGATAPPEGAGSGPAASTSHRAGAVPSAAASTSQRPAAASPAASRSPSTRGR